MSRRYYIFRSILHIQSVSLAGSCRSKCLSTHPVTVLQTGAETCEWCVCKVDHTSQKWISVHLPEYKHVCVCLCLCVWFWPAFPQGLPGIVLLPDQAYVISVGSVKGQKAYEHTHRVTNFFFFSQASWSRWWLPVCMSKYLSLYLRVSDSFSLRASLGNENPIEGQASVTYCHGLINWKCSSCWACWYAD